MTSSSSRPSSSLYTSLPKAPSALSLTVRKLVQRVEAGAVRVPSFQRPLRWTADDVVKLFDSILRGYPIGSLLFWKKSSGLPENPELPVGNALLKVPAVVDGLWIVDGQQRTTALAASLLDLDQRGDLRWSVRYDPRSQQICAGSPTPAEARIHVPLSVLGDLRRLGRWFSKDCDLTPEEQRHVEDVQQRILDYELPCYVVETNDVAALRGVFARLNSTGVRMRADEVFQALLGQDAGSPSGRRALDLSLLQRACDVDGFGEAPRGEVLKAILAMSGLDPSKRLEDLGENAVGKLVDAGDAAEALRRCVAFLQSSPGAELPGAGIPAYAFVPYPVAFIILARWFHLFPSSSSTVLRQLAQWLWRGIATGIHQRAAVSAMRHQVRTIHEGDEFGSLERLLDAVREYPLGEWSLDPFHATHAASRVETLALLSFVPRDKSGPVSWRALLSDGQRVAREVFRVDAFEPGPLRKLARTAANRVLLDARHTNLATELRTWSWEQDRTALESHLIDEAGLVAIQASDEQSFLERRAARMRASVASFLNDRAALDGPRLLPVEAYYAEPEPGISA